MSTAPEAATTPDVPELPSTGKTPLKPYQHALAFAERVSATFAFAFIGVALATGVSDTAALKAAAIAGALSVGKYLYTVTGAYLNT